MASESEQDEKLLPYLRMADDLQKKEPLVAYYCRLYAMEKGLIIPSMGRTKTTNSILVSLMNQLEKDRKSIKLSPEDNLYVEGFASNIFRKSVKEDCAGRADQNTAETFYAAYIIFDILNQFGELQPDIVQKLKYSVWKVADIRKALKEGRRPIPGPPGGEPHLPVTTDTTTGTHNLRPCSSVSIGSTGLDTSSMHVDKDLIRNASFSSTGLTSLDASSPHLDRKQLEMEQESVVDILVKWRDSHLRVKVNFDSDVKDLGLKLLKLTKVKAETMKLLIPVPAGKGSKLMIPFSAEHSSLMLQEIAILEGKPIIMMGAFEDEIQEVSQSNSKSDSRIIGFEEEDRRLRQRSMGISQYSLKLPQGSYIFCDFRTLHIPGIELNPPASEALKRMHTLACDPGIIAIMNKHHWRVGVMTEMAPVGYVGITPKCVLGFNKNFGEEISLRLRTDDLKGFRKYESIKKTLLHELAHMVYSEHDAKFHALDKQLNNEAITLDWTKSESFTLNGTHIPNHYNNEVYVQESYRNSGQKLGGANLMPLSSARASAVVAAYNRYLSASTSINKESQIAGQYMHEKDSLHELSTSVEPEPDDSILKNKTNSDYSVLKYEPGSFESTLKYDNILKKEPDPDDTITKDEPDPDDSIAKDEPDPDDSITKDDPDDNIMKDEPDPDDSITKDDPDGNIMKDEPDPDGIMKDDPDDNTMKDEPDPDDSITNDDPDDNIMKDEPDPDDNIMKDEPDPDDSITNDDPDDNIMKDEPDPDDNIMKEEPDPDDSKPGVIQHNCSMDLSENDELQRIEEPVAIICQRLQKSIELLRFDSTQVVTSTLHTLFKIIMNVIEHPGDDKFRKLRKGNPLFQRTVANHQAAMEVLRVIGFCEAVIMDEIGRSETYLVLKRNDPGLLWLAKSSLEVCFG